MPDAMSLAAHPLSAYSGKMDRRTFEALIDSISESPDPPEVVVYQGQVLDSSWVLKACAAAGVTPKVVEYTGDDPIRFLIQRNLLRRHLTSGQRAMSVVSLCGWRESGRPKNPATIAPFSTDGKPFASVAEMVDLAATSKTYIQMAKRAYMAGRAGDILSGRVTLKEVDRAHRESAANVTNYVRRSRTRSTSPKTERNRLMEQIRALEEAAEGDRARWFDERESQRLKIEALESLNSERLNTIADLEAENAQLKRRLGRSSGSAKVRRPRSTSGMTPPENLRLPI